MSDFGFLNKNIPNYVRFDLQLEDKTRIYKFVAEECPECNDDWEKLFYTDCLGNQIQPSQEELDSAICVGECTVSCWKQQFYECGIDNTFTSFKDTGASITFEYNDCPERSFGIPDGTGGWTTQVGAIATGIGGIHPEYQNVATYCTIPNTDPPIGCAGLTTPLVFLQDMKFRYAGFRICPGEKFPTKAIYNSDQRKNIILDLNVVSTPLVYWDRIVDKVTGKEQWRIQGEVDCVDERPPCVIACCEEFPALPDILPCDSEVDEGCLCPKEGAVDGNGDPLTPIQDITRILKICEGDIIQVIYYSDFGQDTQEDVDAENYFFKQDCDCDTPPVCLNTYLRCNVETCEKVEFCELDNGEITGPFIPGTQEPSKVEGPYTECECDNSIIPGAVLEVCYEKEVPCYKIESAGGGQASDWNDPLGNFEFFYNEEFGGSEVEIATSASMASMTTAELERLFKAGALASAGCSVDIYDTVYTQTPDDDENYNYTFEMTICPVGPEECIKQVGWRGFIDIQSNGEITTKKIQESGTLQKFFNSDGTIAFTVLCDNQGNVLDQEECVIVECSNCVETVIQGCDIYTADPDETEDEFVKVPVQLYNKLCDGVSITEYQTPEGESYNSGKGLLGYFGDCETCEPIDVELPRPDCGNYTGRKKCFIKKGRLRLIEKQFDETLTGSQSVDVSANMLPPLPPGSVIATIENNLWTGGSGTIIATSTTQDAKFSVSGTQPVCIKAVHGAAIPLAGGTDCFTSNDGASYTFGGTLNDPQDSFTDGTSGCVTQSNPSNGANVGGINWVSEGAATSVTLSTTNTNPLNSVRFFVAPIEEIEAREWVSCDGTVCAWYDGKVEIDIEELEEVPCEDGNSNKELVPETFRVCWFADGDTTNCDATNVTQTFANKTTCIENGEVTAVETVYTEIDGTTAFDPTTLGENAVAVPCILDEEGDVLLAHETCYKYTVPKVVVRPVKVRTVKALQVAIKSAKTLSRQKALQEELVVARAIESGEEPVELEFNPDDCLRVTEYCICGSTEIVRTVYELVENGLAIEELDGPIEVGGNTLWQEVPCDPRIEVVEEDPIEQFKVTCPDPCVNGSTFYNGRPPASNPHSWGPYSGDNLNEFEDNLEAAGYTVNQVGEKHQICPPFGAFGEDPEALFQNGIGDGFVPPVEPNINEDYEPENECALQARICKADLDYLINGIVDGIVGEGECPCDQAPVLNMRCESYASVLGSGYRNWTDADDFGDLADEFGITPTANEHWIRITEFKCGGVTQSSEGMVFGPYPIGTAGYASFLSDLEAATAGTCLVISQAVGGGSNGVSGMNYTYDGTQTATLVIQEGATVGGGPSWYSSAQGFVVRDGVAGDFISSSGNGATTNYDAIASTDDFDSYTDAQDCESI